ncbi:metallophosphoesterase family protein [Sediminicola luteus]|uniref:Phosphoesterase n=1 Tax=Sediminicola luteus TaxID=319238 RepID=A0A2A4G8T0_9FLAO|nr:metallophosphoesterase family protein [Sediminicola luteus]PCE64384.1 YfcE family phosphodiesterase [Sediminicola luteus]
MTKILLLSDTHGHIDDAILKHAAWADEIWHAGDIGQLAVTDALQAIKPLRAVFGNIDDHTARKEFKENLLFSCEQSQVLMTHIGGYPPKYNPRSRPLIDQHQPKIFVCGHSHILKVQWDKKRNLLHLNPGACGHHGFHQMRTMLRFVIEGPNIKDMQIVELGKRGSLG